MALQFLTNYQVDEVPSVQEIRSDKVTPISSDIPNRKYIFRLEPQGVLDSNTLLQFKLFRAAGATNDELRVNSFNGILGSVKRVIFRVGDFVLNDTDEVNMWSTLTNLSSRRRIELNRYDAFTLGNQFHTTTSSVDDVTHGQYQVDSSLSGFNFASRTANSLKLQDDENNCYKYGIPLGKLVPALKGREIPLFLFDQYRINLEFEFHPPSVYMNSDSATGTASASDNDATISQVELLVDYIIYPSSYLELKRSMTQKEGGLILDFYNVVNVERQLVVTAGANSLVNTNALYDSGGVLQSVKTSQEFRIGQENREIHQIYMLKKKQTKSDVAYGPPATVTLVPASGGTGYVDATLSETTADSGVGQGLKVTITVVAGAITTALVTTPGIGYKVGEIFTVVGANSDGKMSVTTIGANGEVGLMLEQRIDGLSSESMMWKVNGVDVYPEPKKSTASQYDQTYYSMGYKDLQVERPMFFGDPDSLSSGLTAYDSGLQTTYKPLGYDAKVSEGVVDPDTNTLTILGTGTLIGRYPLVLRYDCTPASTLTTYGSGDSGNTVCARQDGNYDVNFMITTSRRAIIQSKPKGMTVSISF